MSGTVSRLNRGRSDSNLLRRRQQRDELQQKADRLLAAIELGGELASLTHRLKAIESEIARFDRTIQGVRRIDPEPLTIDLRDRVHCELMQPRQRVVGRDMPAAKAAF